jgi:U3 small nucleolar RNA-associated protein 21
VDVVAIGLLDGRIVVHDLRKDETLFTFRQEERVTALSFRTDEHPILASASMNGDIALWNLEERRLAYLMKDAHEGVVTSLEFFHGKPILLTAGADNTLKVIIMRSIERR